MKIGIDVGGTKTEGILLNPNGEFAGIFRPPFDISRLSLTYQSVTTK